MRTCTGGIFLAKRRCFTGQIVSVIVVMPVDAERRGSPWPKDPRVFSVLGDVLWFSRAADMAVQANDTVAFRHHDVKVVRDEQNTEMTLVAQLSHQLVEFCLSREIDAACGLVKDQQVGLA